MDSDRLEDLLDTGPDWSVSRLQTIFTCGRRYKYKYVDKVEEPATPPLAFGSANHSCIYQMHTRNIWKDPDIQRLWDDEWYLAQQLIDWSKTQYRKSAYDAKGIKILENYRDKHQHDEWYVLESHFRFNPNDPKWYEKDSKDFKKWSWRYPMLRGTIDKIQLLTKDTDQVLPEHIGRLAIIDYKTSKNAPDELLLAVDPQLTIYREAVKDILGEDLVVGLHHLPTDKIYWNTRTDEDMKEVLEMLEEGVNRVEEFRFGRNISWTCKFCPYKEDCLGSLAGDRNPLRRGVS